MKKSVVIFCVISIFIIAEASLYYASSKKKIEVQNSTDNKVELLKKGNNVCDGTNVTSNCILDGIEYVTYKYYPEVPQKSHIEKQTYYEEEIIGYCTLCNDLTRSKTCATGRGACSHHGGVKEFNAPIYSKVAKTRDIEVIDQEEIPEKWEIVKK